MIVDDSASMRQLVSFALKDAGYSVVDAVHGKDALAKLQTTKVEMVITDLNMPEMDGITFIKSLRALPGYRFVPTFMLTTESKDNKKTEASQAGATGWIVKPFKPEQLVGIVKKFVK